MDCLSIEHREEILLFHKSMDLLTSNIFNNINNNIKIKIYVNNIANCAIHVCETWSLKSIARLRIFKNRTLRRMFEHKREEYEDCTILQNFYIFTVFYNEDDWT